MKPRLDRPDKRVCCDGGLYARSRSRVCIRTTHTPPPCPALVTPAAGHVTLHDRVIDPTGAPIRDALVRLKPAGGERPNYAKADTAGCFQILASQGNYSLQSQAQGFRTYSNDVVVSASGDNAFDIRLDVGGCTNCVTVIQEPPEASSQPAQVYLCFTDPQGFPADPIHFTLKSKAGYPKRLYMMSGAFLMGEGPAQWGCGAVSSVPWGKYRLTADAPRFQHLKQTLTIRNSRVAQSIQMIPLPTKP